MTISIPYSDLPTAEFFAHHLAGRRRSQWLLRRKRAPKGYLEMSPAQRSRTEFQKQDVFGSDDPFVVVTVFESAREPGTYGWCALGGKHGKVEDLAGYEWCPLGGAANPR